MDFPDDAPGEFDLIETWFAPLSVSIPGAFGLTDDAAVLDVPDGRKLVVSTDMLVSGIHFLDATPPGYIAAKALRVNLSDLAAMAARPLAYTLALALPGYPGGDWLDAFSQGLGIEQKIFNVTLIGGDTVSTTGPLSITITAFGHVEAGRELRRSGAKTGDLVFVSGSIGAAAMGLRVLQGGASGLSKAEQEILIERHYRPQPRIALGQGLSGLAHAAIDVSDGLVQDLGHICRQSNLGAIVEAARVPISGATAAAGQMNDFLSGGDDYELLFCAAPEDRDAIQMLAREVDVEVTVIGTMVDTNTVRVIDAGGGDIPVDGLSGFRHF
ncbi:MAG: thiamine-phosphate kinase [Alphaproteobacteria bacterium]